MRTPLHVSLSDCLDEINHALNYWYPLECNGCDKVEIEARHVRLFEFRNRLENQLKINASLTRAGKEG
jgi:hypothetical protein